MVSSSFDPFLTSLSSSSSTTATSIMLLSCLSSSSNALAADTHGYVGSDVASLCSEAAMQQIRENMDLIDLDKDTIEAEGLDSLGVIMDNFCFALGTSILLLSEILWLSTLATGLHLLLLQLGYPNVLKNQKYGGSQIILKAYPD
ncbi:hypothetical protein PPACK8108_LOCUS9590 [Phakopsora pachyrhizi]|uniref:AAA ATPase AAA+ lid domain-containing protein n=1 Tax=Phakopsora pachyrhizi TaxID=170000 RepID=A0AAV0B023_PHAPC|nr:hypothetical protein PPACK8108_LOCUS9590 [Phakopsora pachyrhizi]